MSGYESGKTSFNQLLVSEIGAVVTNPPEPPSLKDSFGHVARDGSINRVRSTLEKLLGPVGLLADAIVSLGEEAVQGYIDKQNYHTGIKHLSEKNIPGFLACEFTEGGNTYTVLVDASNSINEANSDPYVWTDAPRGIASEGIKRYIEAAKGKALSDVSHYVEQETALIPKRKTDYKNQLDV